MAWAARSLPLSTFFGRPHLLPMNSTSLQYPSSLPKSGDYHRNPRPPQSRSTPFSNDQSGQIVRPPPHGENNPAVTESMLVLEAGVTQPPFPGIPQMPKDVKTAPTQFAKTSSLILSTGGKTSSAIHIRIAVVLANVPSTLIMAPSITRTCAEMNPPHSDIPALFSSLLPRHPLFLPRISF